MASIIHVPHPVAGCLKAAEQVIGEGRIWSKGNDDPRTIQFLEALPSLTEDLTVLAESMKYTASFDSEVVNKFFADNGFPEIHFDAFDPDSFGVGAILNVALSWVKQGESRDFYDFEEGKVYPGAYMKDGGDKLYAENHPYPIAQLVSSNGFHAYMTVSPHEFTSEVELVAYVDSLRATMGVEDSWSDLMFPMISIDFTHDMEWAIGLNTVAESGQQAVVGKAKQITKFKMDHEGAELSSAAAMVIFLESVQRIDVDINKPFLCWITSSEHETEALMIAFFDRDAWKNPKE